MMAVLASFYPRRYRHLWTVLIGLWLLAGSPSQNVQAQTPPTCLPPTAAQLPPATTPDPTLVQPSLVCDLKSVVTSVAYSPDGQRFAAATRQSSVFLFDVTGHWQRTFSGHTDVVTGVAFSPDGKLLGTSSSDHTVRLWDVNNGQALRTLSGHGDEVLAVAFTRDGKDVLSAGKDQSVRVWDVKSGQTVFTFTGHKNAVHALALSPDGAQVVSVDEDGRALLWDLSTGKVNQSFAGQTSASFSPDGLRVATSARSGENIVGLWDAKTGKAAPGFALHTPGVWSVAFSSDGRYLLTGSVDNRARLWDVASGQPIRTFSGDTDWVHSVAFSPDNQIVLTGSNDSTVRLWPSGLAAAPTAQSTPSPAPSTALPPVSPTASPVPNTPAPPVPTVQTAAPGTAAPAVTGHSVVAVAFRLDPATAGMVAYVGNPASKPFLLEAGQYALVAVDEQGRVLTQDAITAQNGQPIQLPADFGAAGGVQDDAMASAIKTLANFLCDAETGELIALQGVSAGFSTPLFDPSARPTLLQLDALSAWYSEILSQQDAAIAALYLIQSKATPGQAMLEPALYLPRPARSARPIPAFSLPFKSLREKLLGFFGYAGDAGKRARQRILLLMATLTAAQRADAFNAIREGFKGASSNWDDFAQRLQSGELDRQALSIESDLRNFSVYGDAAQNANQGTGTLLLQEGSELLKQGAELDAEVIRTVLGQVFPDISKGFDLADKADQWATYIRDVYKATIGLDPAAQREVIQTLIKDELAQSCKEISPDAADQIAAAISQRAMESLQQSNPSAPSAAGSQAAVETPAESVPTAESPAATAAATGIPSTVPITPTVAPTATPTQLALAPGSWSWTLGTVSYAGTCTTGISTVSAASINFVEAPDHKSAQFGASGLNVSLTGDGAGNYQGQAQAVTISIRVTSPTQTSGQLVTTVLGCTITAPFQMSR